MVTFCSWNESKTAVPSQPGRSKLVSTAFSVLDSITPNANGVTKARERPTVVSMVLVLFLEKFLNANLKDKDSFELISVIFESLKLGISGDIESVIAMLAAFLTGKIMNTKLEIILRAIPNSTNLGDKP